jgi:pilus assembly protein Flp/PilA
LIILGLVVAFATDQLQFRGAHSRQVWQGLEEARDQLNDQVRFVLRQLR